MSGVTGLENQSALTVELAADSTYTIDVQFGTCGGNYNSAGEVWIDWNQNTILNLTNPLEHGLALLLLQYLISLSLFLQLPLLA